MIKNMEVRAGDHPGIPALPIGGFAPNNEAVQIRGIDGLGPVKADISTSPLAVYRGEVLQGPHTGKRNIVLTLGLNTDWMVNGTPASLREILYQWFMPENNVELRFDTDERPQVYIYGIVESFDPNIFSQDPEIQISIICPLPDFIAVEGTTLDGSSGETTIDYTGSVSSGFDLHISGSYTGDIEIQTEIGNLSSSLKVHNAHVDADSNVGINTQATLRHVRYENSDGSFANLLGKVDKSSGWPQIYPGPNTFRLISSSSVDWNMFYRLRYGGL